MFLFSKGDNIGLKRNGCNYHLITIYFFVFFSFNVFYSSSHCSRKTGSDNEYWHSSFTSEGVFFTSTGSRVIVLTHQYYIYILLFNYFEKISLILNPNAPGLNVKTIYI